MAIAPAGVQAACVTPFNRDGSIDEGAFAAQLERMASFGFGLFICLVGTGEAQIMRDSEIRRTWEIALKCVKGKVPIIACGIGPTDTGYTIKLANEAGAMGADGVYVYAPRPMPAPVPQPRREVEQFLMEFLDKVHYPIHLANNPFIIGYSIPVDLLAKATARYPHLVSIVNADGAMGYVVPLLRALRSKTAVYEVMTPNAISSLMLGGQGPLSIEAPVAPHLWKAAYDAYRAGDLSQTSNAFAKILKLHDVLVKYQHPTGVKAAMNALGLPGGYPRRPFLSPDDTGLQEIRAVLDEIGLHKGTAS